MVVAKVDWRAALRAVMMVAGMAEKLADRMVGY